MFGSSAKALFRVLILIVGTTGLFLTGCDTFGDDSSDDKTNDDYEVTDDLGNRIDSTSGDKSTSGAVFAKATSVSFNLEARVRPPTVNGTGARATSLSFDGNDNLYIGYLLLGNPFGGGIDVLNASDPTNLSGATSLKSSNTDVQDLTSPPNQDLIYVAEATPPGESDQKSRVSVLRLENGSVNSTSKRISGNVAKSVAVEPSGNQTGHDFHAITDNNSLYRFNNDLSDQTMLKQTVGSGVNFSGLATHQDMVFTLAVDGQLYYSDWASANPLQSDVVNLDSGIDPLGIGRLSAYNQGDATALQDERLFAALGTKGFAVLDDDADDVKYRQTETGSPGPNQEPGYYTSVTLHGNVPAAGGGSFVYGARRWGIIDVYEVSGSGVSNGLNLIRRLYLREAFDLGESDDTPPSVNYVLGVRGSNTLYVSGGEEGTLILNLGVAENPKAISFAAFCTTQGATQNDVSFEVTETNEEGESIKISWTSQTALSTVVLKAGPSMYNYSGGTSGNALSGSSAAEVPGASQSPPRPCPAGETLVFKDETV